MKYEGATEWKRKFFEFYFTYIWWSTQKPQHNLVFILIGIDISIQMETILTTILYLTSRFENNSVYVFNANGNANRKSFQWHGKRKQNCFVKYLVPYSSFSICIVILIPRSVRRKITWAHQKNTDREWYHYFHWFTFFYSLSTMKF